MNSQPYPLRIGAARSGAVLLASSWMSLIVLVCVYVAFRPMVHSGELLEVQNQVLMCYFEGSLSLITKFPMLVQQTRFRLQQLTYPSVHKEKKASYLYLVHLYVCVCVCVCVYVVCVCVCVCCVCTSMFTYFSFHVG